MPWWNPQGDRDHAEVMGAIRGLGKKLDLVSQKQEILMSKADDLKAAIDELATTIADNHTEVEAQLAIIANPGTSDADVDAAIARIRELNSSVKADVDRLKSDNPPGG